MNQLKTTLLLGLLTGLLLWAGRMLGGQSGLMMALIMAVVMNGVAFWFSDRIVLSMYRAERVDPSHASGLYMMVQNLARRAGLPEVAVYIINDPMPNAFATGRDHRHGSVAFTTGLLNLLSREELEGVCAHELSHILNRDTLISSVAAILGGAISSLANFALYFGGSHSEDRDSAPHPAFGFLIMLLAPMAAMLIQLAISRTREYGADEGAFRLCGHPHGLIGALNKLESMRGRVSSPNMEAHPATAHLFIINPLVGSFFSKIFSTHPSTDDRIERLRRLV